MAPDVRDAVVDFVRTWSVKAGITAGRLLRWIGLAPSTYHTWTQRYGKANEHNGDVPRDHWLTADERKAIVDGCNRVSGALFPAVRGCPSRKDGL